MRAGNQPCKMWGRRGALSVRRLVGLGGMVMLIGFGTWIGRDGVARGADREAARKTVSKARIVGGESEDWSLVGKRLDELIESQEQILQQFDKVLAELAIVKTRASRRRAP